MTDFPTFLYTLTCKIRTLSYTRYPFRAEPPRIGHPREFPPPPPPPRRAVAKDRTGAGCLEENSRIFDSPFRLSTRFLIHIQSTSEVQTNGDIRNFNLLHYITT